MKNTLNENTNLESLPFEDYPFQGRKLLGKVYGDNCRHGYGLRFMRLTKQTKCAYCGLDLTSTYENWLNMALDHVIPNSTCLSWEIPDEWREDYSNRVLSCTTCNTFGNRYIPQGFQCPTSLEAFYNVRDAIFIERKRNILDKHRKEREFFDNKPWLNL